MPEAISNTSPLLYLYRIEVLGWLPELFGEVWSSMPATNLIGEIGEMSPAAVNKADAVLEKLRQLPPRERLRVITQALSEVERELQEPTLPLRSLQGLWKDLDFDVCTAEIDEARREAWANFPREDI